MATVDLALFCKSYREDLRRAVRLCRSVREFNRDSIPFYLCVPSQDRDAFADALGEFDVVLLDDAQIVACNARIGPDRFAQLPGGKAQQIVKAEFWRYGAAENYLCLDSDSYFLRDFRRSDFLSPQGHPYTVMHEARELLHFAALSGMEKIPRDRARECAEIMGLFGRSGRCFEFGPTPVVWSGKVWRDLDEKFLAPKGLTIIDAIDLHPGELRWYGEALLAFGGIPLLPIEPIFRCYHYEEQYYLYRKIGESDAAVARNYLGVCRQSNWDKDLDLVKRFRFSKIRRRIRRAITGG
ncbi:MAG TPA: DUF6492 family protein [Burkholderiales bacterium]